MASTVLPNGIIIPEKYSRDWYSDLYHNWEELDNLLGGGTPKDGTLTIQKNGSTVGTFSANQATNETVNIEVPDVNDATLTIQQNGTTVDTFTANSSSDKTVNIQCVDLANNQTVAGNKEFTGTTSAHDVIPSATDTYNFGSSSYQWNNAYIKSLTINGVAAGDILTHNASEFVNVTGAQTIAGVKTFSRISLKSSRIERGSLPSSNITEDSEIDIVDKNDRRILGVYNYYYTDGSGKTSFYAYNPNTTDYDNIAISFNFGRDNQKSLIPTVDNTIDLGISIRKWKSFNGINPGALSLPSISEGVVTVDNSAFQWNTDWTYTPVFDGWLSVWVPASSATKRRYAVSQGSLRYWYPNQNGEIFRFSFPVVKGVSVNFAFISDINEPAAPTINLLKAQGNV